MPFEISPEFQSSTTIRSFKCVADAMLKGCAATYPITGSLADGRGGACALGALLVGTGQMDPMGTYLPSEPDRIYGLALIRYMEHYGFGIEYDNDNRRFTREEIAARIAALE